MNGDMCACFRLNTSARKQQDIACRLWEYTHMNTDFKIVVGTHRVI